MYVTDSSWSDRDSSQLDYISQFGHCSLQSGHGSSHSGHGSSQYGHGIVMIVQFVHEKFTVIMIIHDLIIIVHDLIMRVQTYYDSSEYGHYS